jgi:TRAP-type C4-dicarboxylate transport system substrate-binding protein
MRDQWDKRVSLSRAKVLEAGGEVIDNPDLEPFVKAMEPVYLQFVNSKKMHSLVERIKAVQGTP